MNIILYANGKTDAGETVQQVIKSLVSQNGLERYRTIEGLSGKLRKPGKDQLIAVLVASSRKELSDLLSIHDLLSKVPKILILPDSEKDTVLTAHKFYPRYVTDVRSDFTDVALVIKKMLKNAGSKNKFVIEESETETSSFRKPTLQLSSKEGGGIQNA